MRQLKKSNSKKILEKIPITIEEVKEAYKKYAEEKDMTLFSSGFTRNVVEEAFHLICPELERRVSLVCAEGLRRHKDETITEAETTTARFGGPPDNLIRHMKRHLNKWLAGNRSEDHLAKVAWAIQELMHAETDGNCEHYNMVLEEAHRIIVKKKHL